jgi:acetyl-CoA acyltransferase
VQAVAMAADRIRLGEAEVMIAAGTETMSLMNQIMGNKIALNPAIFEKDENYAIAFGMGITAEKVAAQWKISREDQDAFAVASHQKACAAIAAGHFRAEISPYAVKRTRAEPADRRSGTSRSTWPRTTRGPRPTAASRASPGCGRFSPRAVR